MRQIKRYPSDKEYDFGVGTIDQFGLRKKAGDFITEEDIEKYGVGETYLEPVGAEKENWDGEIPEDANRIMFNIETQISGGDKEEKERMINQFEGEFQNYIRQKGLVVFKVVDVQVIKKKRRRDG